MRTPVRLAASLIGALTIALGGAPAAVAAPECDDVGPTVTFCQTKGSTQLTTTPPPWRYGGWQGIGFWPLVGGYGLGW